MVRIRILAILFAIMQLPLLAFSASAQSTGKTGQFDAWGTYVYQTGGNKVCYVLAIPVPNSAKPPSLDHGDNYFLVSQKPGENVSFEPQFIAGYQMQDTGKVTVTIGAKSFSMFIRGKSAWMENPAEEPQLVAAMKAGSSMSISAVSGRGNATGYEFSLRGITAALNQVAKC